MRTLFINTAGIVGGAEHSLLLLLRGLQQNGVHTHVALLEDGPLRASLDEIGVEHTLIATPANFRRGSRYGRDGVIGSAAIALGGIPAAWRVSRLAKTLGADVIHSNGMKAHMLGGLAGRLAGIPVVWHVRDFPPPGLAGRAFLRQMRVFPHVVVANSGAVKRAVSSGGAEVTALFNPVDLIRFHPGHAKNRLRQEIGVRDDVPIVGMVAHLTPWKGHELFLSIARDVGAVLPGARFVIVGGDVYNTNGHRGYADRLRATATVAGLDDRVTFLGVRDDVADVLADVDVLVHCPTSPEPFGRAIAEAMATGCPVVAARSGGIPEIVEDGKTGILVQPDNRRAFVDAVIRLLQDAGLRARFSAAARARAEAMFSVDAHASAIVEVYHRLAS
jgi:glycosyltransferase involved in cell wall biosynthesis